MKIDFAFVTSSKYSNLTIDDKLLFNALKAEGYICQTLVWDDPKTDWQSARIALLRSNCSNPNREFVKNLGQVY